MESGHLAHDCFHDPGVIRSDDSRGDQELRAPKLARPKRTIAFAPKADRDRCPRRRSELLAVAWLNDPTSLISTGPFGDRIRARGHERRARLRNRVCPGCGSVSQVALRDQRDAVVVWQG